MTIYFQQMTKEEKINKFIAENYDRLLSEVSKNVAKGKMSEYREDLLHHILLYLYKLEEKKIDQLLIDSIFNFFIGS